MFINLNVHSYYSLLNSALSIDDLIQHALDNNQPYVCLTDLNNMYGCIEFYDKAKAHNLIPIIGLEFEYQNTTLVAYAKNYNGYLKLIKWSSWIMTNTTFIIQEDFDDLIIVCKKGGLVFENPNFYQAQNQNASNAIALQSVFYAQENDKTVFLAMLAIKNDLKLDDFIDCHEFDKNYFLNDHEAQSLFSTIALDNLNKVLNELQVEIHDLPINIPVYDKNNLTVSSEILKQLCISGLKQRLNAHDGQVKKVYAKRLKYELDVISEKQFDDYFLIVYDFINYAKSNGIIVGPGRGSAAGSLVAYCLYITDIDPIKHNLIFERFLNPTRKSMPDIDTDIMDEKRDQVIEYLFEKYGNDHVAYIVTFQRLKAKMALRDVGRILGIDLKVIDKICKNIKTDYDEDIDLAIKKSATLKEMYVLHKELFEISKKLIHAPRQIGTHAAGIILSNSSITNIIPIQLGINDRPLSQYSMEYLERFGLIKMDLLGLKNLTIIDNVLKMIYKTQNKKIDLFNIDYNDKFVFQDLAKAKTNGIFQLESPGMKKVLLKVKPQNIEDISIVSALFRPGPQQNIKTFVERRFKREEFSYWNEQTKKILEPTYGIIIYQEQVIELVKTIANFDIATSDNFRRAISKKDEKILMQLKDDFINGALANNYKQPLVNQIFEYIFSFAHYGFNHSHSLAYSYISYWLAYLKHYYPLEFLSVLLSHTSASKEKLLSYLDETKDFNISIKGPDIQHFSNDFVIDNHKQIIRFGFKTIKGFGDELLKKIKLALENAELIDYISYIDALKKGNISLKNIEILIRIGAFDSFEINRLFLLNNLEEIFEKTGLNGHFFDLNLVGLDYANDMSINERFQEDEIQYLGINLSSLNYTNYTNEIDYSNLKYEIESFNEINTNYEVNIVAQVLNIVQSKTKKGNDIFYLDVLVENKKEKLTIFQNSKHLVDEIDINGIYVFGVKLLNHFNFIVSVKQRV
ncbi:DNA polymerase III subunit alpha [Ureaplasma urealyticum]|uniref:DNA-directed DNA polymerase n=1 Tax=Ureaplasma urealyticum TaxID=2130 RepID=A0ABD4SLT8_UREUR|nr:DNA polymerase III subunit alpha [Ureaplasma urealyticum]MCF1349094.1 DNA polymerase III subunit alpha [Ureaplasma urealyticum]